MSGEISVVAIVKGDERYVFMFDDNSRAETLRTLGRYASNPELSFSWYDAAVLSQKIRKTAQQPGECETADPQLDWPVMDRVRSAPPANDAPDFPDIDFTAIDDMWIGDDPQT
ncbi:MAG: hypothetical protein ACR2NP_11735 [Pirellulaceae bacterium]